MPQNSKDHTPYDQFNFEIPEQFPAEGISARAAKAIVTSETWTDANPMLNLSSFVTTFCEPEAKDIHESSMFRNFADPDMYPHTKETEFKCIQWLSRSTPQAISTAWSRLALAGWSLESAESLMRIWYSMSTTLEARLRRQH
jgi:hypothetical protein